MLPVAGSSILSLLFAPLLGRRVNKAYLIGGGLAVSVAGLVILTQVQPGMSPAVLILGWSVINVGAGPFVQPFPGGPSHVYRFITGSAPHITGLGWK